MHPRFDRPAASARPRRARAAARASTKHVAPLLEQGAEQLAEGGIFKDFVFLGRTVRGIPTRCRRSTASARPRRAAAIRAVAALHAARLHVHPADWAPREGCVKLPATPSLSAHTLLSNFIFSLLSADLLNDRPAGELRQRATRREVWLLLGGGTGWLQAIPSSLIQQTAVSSCGTADAGQ
jgi:hypothetical protein